jgi:hypothetical protein
MSIWPKIGNKTCQGALKLSIHSRYIILNKKKKILDPSAFACNMVSIKVMNPTNDTITLLKNEELG